MSERRPGPPLREPPSTLGASARRLAPLAWPVFVGQLAVLAFSTVDTLLVARYAPADLAALAVGAAAYVTVFIGLMGVVMAVGPIAGRHFGAGRSGEAGDALHQTVWLALGLSVLGSALLVFPQPFLALSKAGPDVASRVRGYTLALAFSLPASLLFSAYRGFNTAVSRPKAVMALQLGGLALKVPLSALLVFGAGPPPALGVTGCGIATAVSMWAQALLAYLVLKRDPFYAPFALRGRGLHPPDGAKLRALLRLGVPMGLAIGIEVTGFTFMAFFISRLSATAVAGHQIAANLVALLFMMPLALANATGTLVAQRAGAGDFADARRLGSHGVLIGTLIAAGAGLLTWLGREPIARLYTPHGAVAAAALPLLAWVALFHVFDAAQCVASFALRAWHVATVPVLIYAAAVWGVGLGGGWWLAFGAPAGLPAALQGASAFWAAGTAGLGVAALGLGALLALVQRLPR